MTGLKYAYSGDTKICYHERGNGEPLILIMGFGADGSAWNKHAAEYEKHFRCIIPDNRGVGLSDQPAGPYSTSMMAADIIAVMDDAGIAKAKVAGISMGGAIAQELAINYPGRVQCLVLVSTWPQFDHYTKAVYQNLIHLRPAVSAEYFTELLHLWIYAPPYFEKYHEELAAAALSAANQSSPQTRAGFEGQLTACMGHNATNRLNQIACPALITVGMMDIFTPPAYSYILHRQIPGSAIVTFPEGGHVHHWEDLDRFNKETLDFLLKN